MKGIRLKIYKTALYNTHDHVLLQAARKVLATGGIEEAAEAIEKLREVVERHESKASCSNGGISSRCDSVTLVEWDGRPVKGAHEPSADAPAVKVVKRILQGMPYFHCEPAEQPPEGTSGWMHGGCLVDGTGSGFESECAYPLRLHDRCEKL